jgi:hypothetical protein
MTLPRHVARLAWDHVAVCFEFIESLGLRVSTEHDFSELKRLVTSVPGLFLYPAFDPDAHPDSPLTADEAFWFRVTDVASGETVAWHADRVFETDDFRALLQSGTVWRSKRAATSDSQGAMFRVLRDESAPLAHRIAHAGSLWVAPSHRKRGLSSILPSLSRAVCLLEHRVDYHTGLVFEHLARSGLPAQGYGYPHVELCVDGYFPPTGRPERVYLCHISRDETLADLAAKNAAHAVETLAAAA